MNDSRSQHALHLREGSTEPSQRVDQRAGGMAEPRAGRHAGGLDDHEKVGVLEQDRERDALGQKARIVLDDGDASAGPEVGPSDEDSPVVDADAPGGDQGGEAATGQPQRFIESRFAVESDFQGWRLDRYLKHKIPRLSRTRIQRIIDLQLTIDGRPAKPSTTLRTGSAILIRRPARPEPDVPRHFRVISDDGDVLALDKPAGLPMHPTARYYFGTLTTLL